MSSLAFAEVSAATILLARLTLIFCAAMAVLYAPISRDFRATAIRAYATDSLKPRADTA